MSLRYKIRIWISDNAFSSVPPWSQHSPTTNAYKYYPDFRIKLFLVDKLKVFKQPSEKLFFLRRSMELLGTGSAFLGRSVWITDCLVLLLLQTIGGEKWFPLGWAFCTAWKALMDLWTYFKIKESTALSAMLPWMSKRRWWPSKGFWWGEQFKEINTAFSKCFRSIWVSALEFGRKSTAEVISLLCLSKNHIKVLLGWTLCWW